MSSTHLSRRAILAGASASVVALPIAAAVPGDEIKPPQPPVPLVKAKPDPIFAAIEKWKKADARHAAAVDALSKCEEARGSFSRKEYPELKTLERRSDRACDAAARAARNLARTVPTTMAGALTLLRFAEQFNAPDYGPLAVIYDRERYDDDVDRRVCRDVFITSLRKGLEQITVQS